MIKQKSATQIKLIITLLSIVGNILIFYAVLDQLKGIKDINTLLEEKATQSIIRVGKLTEVERNIGYVGFIHYFKNYVIRRDDIYYDKAVVSYQNASASLNALQSLTLIESELLLIDQIEKTLAQYYDKLELMKNLPLTQSINELDNLVKVDDAKASEALIQLREKLGFGLSTQINQSLILVKKQKNISIIRALLLLPLLLVSTLFTIYLVNALNKLSSEYKSIFNTSPDAILLSDTSGRIIRSNEVASIIFGYSKQELERLSIEDLIDPSLRKGHHQKRKNFSQTKQSRQMRSLGSSIKGLRKDGSFVELSIAISANTINEKMYSVCAIRDLSEHVALQKLATRDHLTSLYNRRALDEKLKVEIHRSVRTNSPLSLLMIDIDNFKQINDNLGHTVGDDAIKHVATQLRQQIRDYDKVGRWGGDEFIILTPGLNVNDALQFAERVRHSVQQTNIKNTFDVTVSIGVATLSRNNQVPAEVLLEQADKALYKAKQAGRNQACI